MPLLFFVLFSCESYLSTKKYKLKQFIRKVFFTKTPHLSHYTINKAYFIISFFQLKEQSHYQLYCNLSFFHPHNNIL